MSDYQERKKKRSRAFIRHMGGGGGRRGKYKKKLSALQACRMKMEWKKLACILLDEKYKKQCKRKNRDVVFLFSPLGSE